MITQTPVGRSLSIVLALAALVYATDALFPTWDWECRRQGGQLGGLLAIPEVADEVRTGQPQRHLSLTLPPGCSATPRNSLRRGIEWWRHG